MSNNINNFNKKIGSISIGIVLFFLLLVFWAFGTTRIDAGYVGIIYNVNGGIENKTLSQGLHIVAPWKHVREYSVATEQACLSKDKKEGSEDDDSFMIPTSDGKTLNVDLEFSYHFDVDKLPDTFVRFKGQSGKDIERLFIRAKIKSWASEVSSQFSVLDVYGAGRARLNNTLYKHSKEKFAPYGIVIDSVNFSRIGLDAQTARAIQERINAQQLLEKAKIERDKAVIEAEKVKEQAKGEKEARLIKAEGESKANIEIQKSLTPTLVEYFKAQRWDGKLPTTLMNGKDNVSLLQNVK